MPSHKSKSTKKILVCKTGPNTEIVFAGIETYWAAIRAFRPAPTIIEKEVEDAHREES
jgi:hypothetical protein